MPFAEQVLAVELSVGRANVTEVCDLVEMLRPVVVENALVWVELMPSTPEAEVVAEVECELEVGVEDVLVWVELVLEFKCVLEVGVDDVLNGSSLCLKSQTETKL